MTKQSVSAGRASSSAATDTAAPPIVLAVDDRGRQSRQRRAGEHMLGTEHMAVVVEIGFGAGAEIDGAEHEPDSAGIDPVEIDRGVQQLAQLRRARSAAARARRSWRPRVDGPSASATRPASQRRTRRGTQPSPPSRDAPAQLLPEPAQPRNPFMRQIAGDDRGIDRADRGAGDPVRPDAGMFERGIGPGLIGAETAAARQHQRDPVETGQALLGSRARQDLLPEPRRRSRGQRRRRSISCS